ncbi:MAG: DUF1467 family protein [Proteobacteria bacterium]|nr:DUF1467 family protein [Pseudomonadota bacterium]
MTFVTGLMVYVICWWLIWFMILPIGIVTQQESGEKIVKGTVKSAPVRPRLLMKALATTIVTGLVWGVIYYLIETA